MLSKLKCHLNGWASTLVVAALLSFTLAAGSVKAHAEDVDASACPPPSLDIVADLAEELDVLCHAQALAAVLEPTAIEGQAIRVEITQSVTVAALGQDVEKGDDATDLLP